MRTARIALIAAWLAAACARDAEPATTPTSASRLEVLGQEQGVGMARVHLAPGETFDVAASSCQLISVFVERGAGRSCMQAAAFR